MNSILRFNRLWAVISDVNSIYPHLRKKLTVKTIGPGQACSYSKKYGLYDNEEEESFGEFNKRGAYVDHRGSKFEKNRNSFGDDNDDEDMSLGGQPRSHNRFPHQRQNSFNFRNRRAFDEDDEDSNNYSSDSAYDQSRHSRNRQQPYGYKQSPFGSYGNYSHKADRYSNSRRYTNQLAANRIRKPPIDVDFNPIEKNFYKEHDSVSARSQDEIDEFHKTMNIVIRGENVPRPISTFDELCIPESLMQAIKAENFSAPTAIQSQGWPIALSGRDMIGISQTGSGKTLVFALPAIVHIMNQTRPESAPNVCYPQALVLAPTRELAQQIHGITHNFRHSCGIHSGLAYGGASKMVQFSKLKNAQICIGTPGRMNDFLDEGAIDLKHCTYLVLDEADRMLDMGFEPQIRQIIEQIRPDRQTLMWSATWPEEVQTLAEDFLTDYVQVTIGNDQLRANPNIEQNIYIVNQYEKENKLRSLLNSMNENGSAKVLVFAQTKRTVSNLAFKLNQQGIFAMAIHGDVSQSGRDRVLHNFRNQKSGVLIATDVAARGLDVTDIQHVVNFDFPTNIEDYIHRIGRTARGIKSGKAHSFLTQDDAGIVRDLLKVLQQANQSPSEELLELSRQRSDKRGNNRFFGGNNRYQQRRNFY